MAKTKIQKAEAIEAGLDRLNKSETIVFADFSGLPVNKLNAFRKSLNSVGAVFRVIKKRLLKIILQKNQIVLDSKNFEGQVGVVFSSKDVVETSNVVYQFAKQNDKLKILGGFDLKDKHAIEADDIKRIGQLPSREILLGQLVSMMVTPIRQFLFVLNEKTKKV